VYLITNQFSKKYVFYSYLSCVGGSSICNGNVAHTQLIKSFLTDGHL